MDKGDKRENTSNPQAPVKTRKVYSGPTKEKARTMQRLVAAVGGVIQKKGYAALSAASVARECGLNKQLVWTYFGGLDNVVEEYIRQRDFWKHAAKMQIEDLLKDPEGIGKEEIARLLQDQLEVVLKDEALQKIIHWELGENKEVLRKIADEREEVGEQLFGAILPAFEDTAIDLRARIALIIGGIYYLSLHATTNGSTFCGIDLNDDQGKERISAAIQEMVFEAYEQASD